MRKTALLIFTALIFICHGQKHDAKFYLKNGKVLTGKADMILNSETKVKFKDNETNKTEKIKFEELSKVEYFENGSDVPVTFERMEMVWRKGKPKIESVWLKKIEDGSVKYYISKNFYDGYTSMSTGNTMTPTTFTSYYFQYENQKPELIYYLIDKSYVKNRKEILGYIEPFFKNTCPALIQAYKDGKIKLAATPQPLLDYYKQNCEKPN